MKQILFTMFALLTVILSGCGNDHANGTVNGNWTATLLDQNGTQIFMFSTTLTQSGNTAVTVTNLNFTTASPCFVSSNTASGAFVLSGNFNGNVTGNFQLTVQSGTPGGNMLMLQGKVNNNVISGTWSLTGVTSGCNGSGTFTMTKM